MRAAALAGIAIAGIAAGCGGASDEARARDTTKAFVTAIRARDGAKACSYLTPNGREIYTQLGDVPCEQGILAAPFARGAKVGKAQVKGGRATVALEMPGAPPVIVSLKKQGSTWKVDSTG